MSSYISQLRGPQGNLGILLSLLDAIADQGGTVSAGAQTIRANWEKYQEARTQDNALDNLTQAVASTKALSDKDAKNYWDQARLAGAIYNQDKTDSAVAQATLDALREEYAKSNAKANHQLAVDQYNEAAQALTAALAVVDPDLTADEVLLLDQTARDAYLAAPMLAAQLTQAEEFLQASAALARVPEADTKRTQIALAINWDKAHRRRVWEAWDNTDSRAGKWKHLIDTGAQLHAEQLDEIKDFAELAALEVRQKAGSTGIRQFNHDPEDDDFEKRTKQ